ncbi:MAG: hypothetical protein ACRDRD_21435, partial [Pseudonocardiaceae bacterium]
EEQVPVHLQRTVAALAAASILTAAPAARAAAPHHHQQRERSAGIVGKLVAHEATPRTRAARTAETPTHPLLGFGGGAYDGCSATPEPGMRFVRIILYRDTSLGLFEACAANAHQAGLRLIVSVQYNADWSMSQIEAWFRQALATYVPYRPYAISIGNEQELGQSGGSPESYHEVWDAVEPIVAATDPSAIRVAGEISPWGLAWFEQAAALGLPGAQAFAAHPYPDSQSPWASTPSAFVKFADVYHMPAWATEGMCGPGAWTRYGCLPESTFARDGFALAVEWYAPSA